MVKDVPLELERYHKLCHRLYEYVRQRTLNSEENLPTFRELARRYRITHHLVEQIIDDTDSLAYNIGIGGHAGFFAYKHKGDYTAEWMD